MVPNIGSTTDQSTADSTPSRVCIVCRKHRQTGGLLRLALLDGELVLDRPRRGRAAYVCTRRECLVGLNAKSVGRAFKSSPRLRLSCTSSYQCANFVGGWPVADWSIMECRVVSNLPC